MSLEQQAAVKTRRGVLHERAQVPSSKCKSWRSCLRGSTERLSMYVTGPSKTGVTGKETALRVKEASILFVRDAVRSTHLIWSLGCSGQRVRSNGIVTSNAKSENPIDPQQNWPPY